MQNCGQSLLDMSKAGRPRREPIFSTAKWKFASVCPEIRRVRHPKGVDVPPPPPHRCAETRPAYSGRPATGVAPSPSLRTSLGEWQRLQACFSIRIMPASNRPARLLVETPCPVYPRRADARAGVESYSRHPITRHADRSAPRVGETNAGERRKPLHQRAPDHLDRGLGVSC